MEVVLGITGSIAAYKAAELVRLLVKAGHNVNVVMTEGATRFITPLTFQTLSRNPVITDLFAPPAQWEPRHISLAERADVLAIAPCTANVIAKLACGLADDALSATALACRAPLVIAPAMNDAMFEHPATVANIDTLRSRGTFIVEPEIGELACGSQGRGRLASIHSIFDTILAAFTKAKTP